MGLLLRFSIGYFFVSQHSQSAKLEKEKIRIQMELSQIKSIQLELVRHSKLERNLIKIDKELEKLKANQIPKEKQMKFHFQIARVCLSLFLSSMLVIKTVLDLVVRCGRILLFLKFCRPDESQGKLLLNAS